jgi:hypothetical protein
MIASRTAATRAAARTLRAPIRAPRQTRFASTTQSEAAKAGGVSGYAAGVAGGATVFLVRSSTFLSFHSHGGIASHLRLTSSNTTYRLDTHTTTSPGLRPS